MPFENFIHIIAGARVSCLDTDSINSISSRGGVESVFIYAGNAGTFEVSQGEYARLVRMHGLPPLKSANQLRREAASAISDPTEDTKPGRRLLDVS